jgi:uncharacterized membrane protein
MHKHLQDFGVIKTGCRISGLQNKYAHMVSVYLQIMSQLLDLTSIVCVFPAPVYMDSHMVSLLASTSIDANFIELPI